MQKAVCAWAAHEGTESRSGAHDGHHRQLASTRSSQAASCNLKGWDQPQKASACLVSGGTSLWEKQFSAAVAIFKPEA